MTTQVRTICVTCARGTHTFVKQYRSSSAGPFPKGNSGYPVKPGILPRYPGLAVGLTIPGILTPVTGALLHELSSLPVIANSARPISVKE